MLFCAPIELAMGLGVDCPLLYVKRCVAGCFLAAFWRYVGGYKAGYLQRGSRSSAYMKGKGSVLRDRCLELV